MMSGTDVFGVTSVWKRKTPSSLWMSPRESLSSSLQAFSVSDIKSVWLVPSVICERRFAGVGSHSEDVRKRRDRGRFQDLAIARVPPVDNVVAAAALVKTGRLWRPFVAGAIVKRNVLPGQAVERVVDRPRGEIERLIDFILDGERVFLDVGPKKHDPSLVRVVAGSGRQFALGVVVQVHGGAPLLEHVRARRTPRRLAGRLDGRQQQCDEDANDGDDDQEFDQGEPT